MTKDVKREAKEKLVNKQHINDLQTRLDNVANRAEQKGSKVQIGSTMPYAVIHKREAKRQHILKRRQFGNYVSSITGKSLTYLKDGEYIPR